MLTFPARVPGLNDSLVTFPALAIAVGEGQMRTVSAMDFGLGPVDRLSALPAEVGLALIGVMEPFTAPTARTLQNAYIAIRVASGEKPPQKVSETRVSSVFFLSAQTGPRSGR